MTTTETPSTSDATTTPTLMTTTERTSTSDATTTTTLVTTTEKQYECLDLIVDHCRDETLDVIGTFPNIVSLDDCQTLCNVVYKDVCNSYIYYMTTQTCSTLRDNFSPYLYDCGIFGGGSDILSRCLQDDSLYPNQCKYMLESECVMKGNKLAELPSVFEPEECLLTTEIFHGSYYVLDVTTQTCTIYDSNERVCEVQRGINDLSNCPP